MSKSKRLSTEDITALREWLTELEYLNEHTPDSIPPEVRQEIEATGKIPDKYKGRLELRTEKRTMDYLQPGETADAFADQIEAAKKRIILYDAAIAAHDKKYEDLGRKYNDVLVRAATDREADLVRLVRSILRDPERRKKLVSEIPILGSMPSNEVIDLLFRTYGTKSGRIPSVSSRNKHESIRVTEAASNMYISRENKQKGSRVIIQIEQADNFLSNRKTGFQKMLAFVLQKMAAQNLPLDVGFSLQELVDLGMYKNVDSARKAVNAFFSQQLLMSISGAVKKGRKTIEQAKGVLFYNCIIKNSYVILSVNDKFNLDFIATYFTVFPRFAYALGNNAFLLVRYILYLARQNTAKIKGRGSFTVTLEAVRANLGLPAPEEVANRKYKQYIICPIENAIEEVEQAIANMPEAGQYDFTITPYYEDTGNIYQWLEGYLEIGLGGEFAKTFIKIATEQEKAVEKFERAKITQAAKIAVGQKASKAKK